uniref:P-loop containing nucleoside triphosphate hydrolase protein n=1 Tax=Kwoniella bestiolae CBS 10118 TaxID=1296100 RepID=A0A1B9FU99_9TREE|nr:hypothetical protein I302_07983 [Kwoniella bestiolae CBS 10118]OCF22336.1 hypothetical protein I302_07983 [Kwoniella bestiolae CBS 10118]
MSKPFWKPTSAPPGIFKDVPLPHQDASWPNKVFCNWVGEMMKVAWSRSVQEDDLFELTSDYRSRINGDRLKLNPIKPSPTPTHSQPGRGSSLPEKEKHSNSPSKVDGEKYNTSLLKAIYLTIRRKWWLMQMSKLVAVCMRMMVPIIVKHLIRQLTRSYEWHNALKGGRTTEGLIEPLSVGHMAGASIGIWLMMLTASMMLCHAWWRSRLTGMKVGSGLITLIAQKAMQVSDFEETVPEITGGNDGWSDHDDGFSRYSLDRKSVSGSVAARHRAVNLAARSFCFSRIRVWMFKHISRMQSAQNQTTDGRVRLLSEILNNIRSVKLYAYEKWFSHRISEMRNAELDSLRKNNLIKSSLTALMGFIPPLAAILTFINYALTDHPLDAATVFSSLQWFISMRLPIVQIPDVLASISEAKVGIRSKGTLASFAIDVQGDFQFENDISVGNPEENAGNAQKHQLSEKVDQNKGNGPRPSLDKRFALKDIDIQVSRGEFNSPNWSSSLVCVVGRVGTGKTALLSGLMKQVRGHVVFGGSISYVLQQAWVQSGTIRENITFSCSPDNIDLARVNQVIDTCGPRHDIDMWPDGDLTRIGERGITLSGGQRQRICIARAAYQDSDVVLLDDSLSAVDAHVGSHILKNCILSGPMGDRTKVLITHHLDILPEADLVLVVDRDDCGDGRIVQKGTYQELKEEQGIFRTLMDHSGSLAMNKETLDDTDVDKADHDQEAERNEGKIGQNVKLIIDEERPEGAVKYDVYFGYLKSIRSVGLVVRCGLLLIFIQIATVLNTLFLGYWSEGQFDLSQGAYMGIYAGLGISVALFTCGATYSIFLAGTKASCRMFNQAWQGVMRSPTSWHDRTPTGRLINRLSKATTHFGLALTTCYADPRMYSSILGILGAFTLILYTYPWAGLLFIPVLIYDWFAVLYYRQTSREIKRLTSNLRSHIYTNLGEQLAGLTVIRAFGQQERFLKKLEASVDTHFVSHILDKLGFLRHRWLGRRITLVSQLLAVMMFGIIFRYSVSPAKFGVVLTFIIAATTTLNQLVNQVTEAEQQMNTVERVQYYMSLPTEAPVTSPDDPRSDEEWPRDGGISFKDVEMRYRPELPLILKGTSFDIRPGEKVGVIGRTGAGKSSLVQALFRTVELCGGKIEIDGKDISQLGLDGLRKGLGIIPQDPFLFGGTVRLNIDPTGVKSDAVLNDALRLIYGNPEISVSTREKFHLDVIVANEGSNFSAGERQLLMLIRALVRGSKILILDEATSSVDPETDALIQRIIQTEFSDIVIVSIAHRIQTVAYYDRILVMDVGQVVEFDHPLELFDRPDSMFRGLCDRKVGDKSLHGAEGPTGA